MQPPFKLSEAMTRASAGSLREFLGAYRERFAVAVRQAGALSDRTARGVGPDAGTDAYNPSSAEIF